MNGRLREEKEGRWSYCVHIEVICKWRFTRLPNLRDLGGTVGERKEQQVVIRIVVTTRNKLIVKVSTDIINHQYIHMLDIWELEEGERKKKGGQES